MHLPKCTAAVAALSVSACDGLPEQVATQIASLGGSPNATSAGIRTLSLLDGSVRVRSPDGYCIDQGASDAASGFVVLAGCALMSEDVALMPSLDGLITVQFGAADTASVGADEEAFAEFLTSDAGKGVLSLDGSPGSIGTVSTVVDEGIVLARFEDTSGPVFGGTSGPQWRGFVDLNGRLVTVSVLSFDRAPLSRAEGQRLMSVALVELINANDRPNDDETDEN